MISANPETQPPATTAKEAESCPSDLPASLLALVADGSHGRFWVFCGDQGLRAGWSVVFFAILSFIFTVALGSIATVAFRNTAHLKIREITPTAAFLQEIILFLSILGAGALVALVERRRILDYNLTSPRRLRHFLGGLAAGFVALSALVGALCCGGWLRFGPVTLSGTHIVGFAAAWGVVFLLTGFFEEGSFRCYLQFTLTRGINFWWALGLIALLCLGLALTAKGNGVWGVYAFALLGLLPCFWLHASKAPKASFWQASWVTSTFFGFIHVTNNGENWVGIFAAAAIGFVFCVSVRVTGSAWWAIGCHASWDWAETYFYGTADSGLVTTGHLLSSVAVNSSGQGWMALWSGGADGPEGSLLVLPVVVLLLALLLAMYGRKPQPWLQEKN
jgi:membrane protease YdiL (CAAX protease family)